VNRAISAEIARRGFVLEHTGGNVYVHTRQVGRGVSEYVANQYSDPPRSLDEPVWLYRYVESTGREQERAYPSLRVMLAELDAVGSPWGRRRGRGRTKSNRAALDSASSAQQQHLGPLDRSHAPELDAAELRRCLARDGLPADETFHGRDPYVGVVEVGDRSGSGGGGSEAVGGRYFPARNALLVYRHVDPEVTRATVVHELAHHRSYQEECGGTERSNRTRCRYRGEHDPEFYARLEPMYREARVPVYAARAVERDYDYPARWRRIERW